MNKGYLRNVVNEGYVKPGASNTIANYLRKVIEVSKSLSQKEQDILNKAILDGTPLGDAVADYFEALNKIRRVVGV